MATLNIRANTFLTTTNTTWSTTASAVDGAYGVNSATYSVWTNTTANAVGTIEVGFGTQLSTNIPANAVLTNVSITLRQLVSQAARVPTVTFQPFDGATAIGSPSTATNSTSAVSNTVVFTPTLAQLRSSTFKVKVSATRFNGTQAGTFSIDFVDISVTYTVPVAIATFVEPFNDLTAWSGFGTPAATASAGRLKCGAPSLPGAYTGVTTTNPYVLSNSSVFLQVWPDTSIPAETTVNLYNVDSVLMSATSTSLLMRVRAASVNSDQVITFDPVAHAWWRMGASGTTITWDTSPDGITWTNRRTATSTADLSLVQMELSNGGSGYPVTYFDNINIPGTLQLSPQDGLGISDTESYLLSKSTTDLAGATDSDAYEFSDSVSDSAGLTDPRAYLLNREGTSDGMDVTDSTSLLRIISVSDPMAVSDSIYIPPSSLVNYDQLTALKGWSGSLWDRRPFTEWDGTAWVRKRLRQWTGSAWADVWPEPIMDAMTVGDSLTFFLGAVITRDYSDSQSLSDLGSLSANRALSDLEGLTDVRSVSADRSLLDITGLVDARSISATTDDTDNLALSDTSSSGVTYARSYSDTTGLRDSATAAYAERGYSDSAGTTDSVVASFLITPPSNFVAKWVSTSLTTLQWTDAVSPGAVYDIYYSDAVLTDWTTGTPLAIGVAPGVQTLTHVKDVVDQSKTMLYYGIISRTTSSAPAVVRGVPKFREAADWLPSTIAPGDAAIQGLVHITAADVSKVVAFTAYDAYTVDWGDGSAAENIGSGVTASHTYTYATMSNDTAGGQRQALMTIRPQAGQWLNTLVFSNTATRAPVEWTVGLQTAIAIYAATSGGSFSSLKYVSLLGRVASSTTSLFFGVSSLVGVFGKVAPTGADKASNMFYQCAALKYLPEIDMAAATSAVGMFSGCTALPSAELALINTSGITDFSSMFRDCSSDQFTTIPLIDTSNGTNFSNMFYGCTKLTSVPALNTAAGTNFAYMFRGCTVLADINITSVEKGTTFNNMFTNCAALTSANIPAALTAGTGTSNGTDFAWMFQSCNNVGFTTIPLIDTSKGTDFSNMFYGCNKLTSVPALNTAAGTNFAYMFYSCTSLIDASITSVANGTSFSSMFSSCTSLTTANIPAALTTGVGTGNGINFTSMFASCTNVGFTTIPLIDTSKGTSFGYMFQTCNKLTSVPALNTANGTTFNGMFQYCSALVTAPITNVEKGTTFGDMFNQCSALTTDNIPAALTTGTGTGNATSFSYMFRACNNVAFTTIPLIDTSKGLNFNNMFDSCTFLTTIPLIDTSKGTNFTSMFAACGKLTSVPALNCAAGTTFSTMFSCPLLTTIGITGVCYSISIGSCVAMPPANIDTFYTNLGTAAGAQTVTVTGMAWQDESTKSIATAKGWTVSPATVPTKHKPTDNMPLRDSMSYAVINTILRDFSDNTFRTMDSALVFPHKNPIAYENAGLTDSAAFVKGVPVPTPLSDTVPITDSMTYLLSPAPPANFIAKWTSATINTLTWTDVSDSSAVYDIYYSDQVLSNWTQGTPLATGIAAGVQTRTHTKDVVDQDKSMLYYAIIARSAGGSYVHVSRAVPKFREAADWLPCTLTPGEQGIQGLVHITSADVSKVVSISASGAYTVDWGDGSAAENLGGGNSVTHTYTYATMSNAAAGGQRQAMMTVLPQPGVTFTSFMLVGPASTRSPVEFIFSGVALSTLQAKSSGAANQLKYVSLLGRVQIGSTAPFSGITSLVGVFGKMGFVTNTASVSAFSGCTALVHVPDLDAEGVTSASTMFNGCTALTSAALTPVVFSNFSNITNFTSMFFGCTNVGFTTVPLIDTSGGTNFTSMFANSNRLTSIPALNTANGTTFTQMFSGCSALTDINFTSVENGTNFSSMFLACSALTSAGISSALTAGTGTGNGTNFSGMFYNCTSAGFTTVPLMDTSKGTDFSTMFLGCNKLTSVPALNTANGTTFTSMFYSCTSLVTAPITSVEQGTNFGQMFYVCTSLTSANIPAALTTGAGTSNGTNFSSMFNGCSNVGFTSIPPMNTSKGTNFSAMFNSCNKLTSVPTLDTTNGTDFSYMFYGCTSLARPQITSVEQGFNFSQMFYTCYALTTANIPAALTTGTGTGNGTNFSSMFYGCTSLTTIPLIDTSKGTNFNNTLNGCSSLTSVPALDTRWGTNFSGMFSTCNNVGFTTIPLIDTSNGTTFISMFYSCTKLTSVPALNTAAGTNFQSMFYNCTSLVTAPITSVASATTLAGMFQSCTALTTANIPAALTTGVGTGNCTNFGSLFSTCTNVGFTTIPLIDTSKGTDFSSMLAGCSKLTSVPTLNTAMATTVASMFSACTILPTVPALNVAAVISGGFASMLASCGSCTSVLITGAKYSITLNSCAVSMPTANINTFYTNLGTAAGAQTVTVTGMTNQAASTKSIATAKGWTVA